MKFLIITQAIDTEHPILGFFHRWVEEFAKHCEHVHVIALQVGSHQLPANVTVHSLGKELKKGRLSYLIRFYTLIWSLRKEYDNVFVHMNPIYVVLGGPFWQLWGKRIGLWYTHPSVDLKLKIATKFSNVIFTGSESSFGIMTIKRNVMGQGIDPSMFQCKSSLNTTTPTMIVVGRISPIKYVENAIHTLKLLSADSNVRLVIVGGPATIGDESYISSLKALAVSEKVSHLIDWKGALPPVRMQEELSAADIFIHTSLTHSADKTLPEAMSSGLFVVSSSRAYEGDLPKICFCEPKPELYAKAIRNFLSLSQAEQEALRHSLRGVVEEKHSLKSLVSRIVDLY